MKISVVITTFNNQRTLPALLKSVSWADEILVLDSFSTDETVSLAKEAGCRLEQHAFLGYGPQKQMALELARHEWQLLLDADEMVSPELAEEIQHLLAGSAEFDVYEIPRCEQVFWRMDHPSSRLNHYLRLFRKGTASMCDMPVHAAPKTRSPVGRLKGVFYHFGEPDIHTRIEKLNGYSTGLVNDSRKRYLPALLMLVYPPFAFLKHYLFKRQFLNGMAGLISCISHAFYAFMKYAKYFEKKEFDKRGTKDLPANAPPLPEPPHKRRKY